MCARKREDLQKSAASSSHRQLFVCHGPLFGGGVGEKQRWSNAIFITSFLSVSLSGLQVYYFK